MVEAVRRYDPDLPCSPCQGRRPRRRPQRPASGAWPRRFADRAYTAEGRRVRGRSRGRCWATTEGRAPGLRMATEGRVEAAGGGEVAVEVRSLCVHGDTPGAVELARAVRAALEQAGVTLEPFA